MCELSSKRKRGGPALWRTNSLRDQRGKVASTYSCSYAKPPKPPGSREKNPYLSLRTNHPLSIEDR